MKWINIYFHNRSYSTYGQDIYGNCVLISLAMKMSVRCHQIIVSPGKISRPIPGICNIKIQYLLDGHGWDFGHKKQPTLACTLCFEFPLAFVVSVGINIYFRWMPYAELSGNQGGIDKMFYGQTGGSLPFTSNFNNSYNKLQYSTHCMVTTCKYISHCLCLCYMFVLYIHSYIYIPIDKCI